MTYIPIRNFMDINGETRFVFSILVVNGVLKAKCSGKKDTPGVCGNCEVITIKA
jgi:hypothetical protein